MPLFVFRSDKIALPRFISRLLSSVRYALLFLPLCSDHTKQLTIMAAAGTVPFSAARILQSPRCLASIGTPFTMKRPLSKMGWQHLQRTVSVSARKLMIRAARTESKGVSLGFRAPQFQVSSPLSASDMLNSLEVLTTYL